MQRFLLTLGVLVCSQSIIFSDDSTTSTAKAPIQKITYVRHMPAAVARKMPRGAKSCFAGWFKLTSKKPDLFLHLYSKNPKELIYDSSNTNNREYHFTVDIFRIKQKKSVSILKLIRRFPLAYMGQIWPPEKFGASALWLDPKVHKMPILKFDCFGGDQYVAGYNVLATFPKGLTGKPVIQSFGYGSWRASDTSGQDNWFDEIDEVGLIQIRTQTYLSSDEIPSPPPVIYRWNGKEFAPVAESKSESVEKPSK